MVDEIDRAMARADEQLQDALSAQARRARKHLGETSALDCVRCDEPIPTARRLAIEGVQHCVSCARALERKARHP